MTLRGEWAVFGFLLGLPCGVVGAVIVLVILALQFGHFSHGFPN